jgi:hypothetical protein
MSPKRALVWLVLSILIVQVHQLFEHSSWSGDLFPFAKYPQTFQWYVFSLCKKIAFAVILGVYAYRETCRWLSYMAMTYWLFEVDEIFDYVLFANRGDFIYEVGICLSICVLFLLLELKKLNLTTFEYEEGYDYENDYS